MLLLRGYVVSDIVLLVKSLNVVIFRLVGIVLSLFYVHVQAFEG